jgi:RNA recognition motif-containing protein
LFAGNLPRSWTSYELENAFAKYGRVVRATVFYQDVGGVPTNGNGQCASRSAGCGKVSFCNADTAENCLANMQDAQFGQKRFVLRPWTFKAHDASTEASTAPPKREAHLQREIETLRKELEETKLREELAVAELAGIREQLRKVGWAPNEALTRLSAKDTSRRPAVGDLVQIIAPKHALHGRVGRIISDQPEGPKPFLIRGICVGNRREMGARFMVGEVSLKLGDPEPEKEISKKYDSGGTTRRLASNIDSETSDDAEEAKQLLFRVKPDEAEKANACCSEAVYV